MTDIVMPKLSDSMEEGLVLQWLIEDGAPVAVGDELLEIETDKATMTYASESDGTLEIVVDEGTTVAVGELIARVGPPGAHNGTPQEPREEVVAVVAASPTAAADRPPATPPATPVATPVARRVAAARGIALDELTGTGPRGRITKTDVLVAAGEEVPKSEPAPAPAAPQTIANGDGATRTIELSRLQQVVARRMSEAKATIPHFQVQTEVVVDAAIAMRRELKALVRDREAQPVPSFNDLIVKACAIALRRHPHANGSYREGRFELHEHVNVGIAVAADDALVVATVRDADTKSLGQIARDTRLLAERVRSGEITPPELSGATFTVSNLGMFGMTAITPVINPPQAAILGVGQARDTLARENGEIVDRSLLTLTLSCDHRILYGADAAGFLSDVKALLESPLALTL